MVDLAPPSKAMDRSYCAISHCSGFETDKFMKAAMATNAKGEVAGTAKI